MIVHRLDAESVLQVEGRRVLATWANEVTRSNKMISFVFNVCEGLFKELTEAHM